MKNSEIEISEYLRVEGEPPIVDWEALPREGLDLFRAFEETARTRVILASRAWQVQASFKVFFLHDSRFGAFAARPGTQNLIAIYAGTISSLMDFFSRVFSTFDVSEGIWREKSILPDMPGVDQSPLDAWRRCAAGLPDDPFTQTLIVEMVRLAFAFIVDHEWAHIVLGHCDYSNANLSRRRMDTGIDQTSQTSALVDQAMELQADHSAVILALQTATALERRDLPFPEPIRKANAILNDSKESRIFSTLLAIFSVFRLFDENHWTDEHLLTASHPPSPIRIVHALVAATHYFHESKDVSWQSAHDGALKRLFAIGEEIFARALRRAPNGTAVVRAAGNDGLQHYERLKERMVELETQLNSMI